MVHTLLAEPTHSTSYYAKPIRCQSLALPRDEFWPELGTKIALAGGIYPVFVVAAWVLIGLLMAAFLVLTGTAREAREFGLVAWPLAALLWSPLFFGSGFILAAILSMVVLPSVAWTLRLLGKSPRRGSVATFCGSAVATLAMSPFSVSAFNSPRLGGFVMLTLHLGVAIAFGQAAGLLASLRCLRSRKGSRLEKRHLRLSLFQVMAAMLPLAIGLTLLRILSLAILATAATLLLALALHFVTQRPVLWLVNRWADRQIRRHRQERLAARST